MCRELSERYYTELRRLEAVIRLRLILCNISAFMTTGIHVHKKDRERIQEKVRLHGQIYQKLIRTF